MYDSDRDALIGAVPDRIMFCVFKVEGANPDIPFVVGIVACGTVFAVDFDGDRRDEYIISASAVIHDDVAVYDLADDGYVVPGLPVAWIVRCCRVRKEVDEIPDLQIR